MKIKIKFKHNYTRLSLEQCNNLQIGTTIRIMRLDHWSSAAERGEPQKGIWYVGRVTGVYPNRGIGIDSGYGFTLAREGHTWVELIN
jgi:hypothetical protein